MICLVDVIFSLKYVNNKLNKFNLVLSQLSIRIEGHTVHDNFV